MSENASARSSGGGAKQVFNTKEWHLAVGASGDIVLTLVHRCGCCRTVGFFAPGDIDEVIDELRFAQATGVARKAGAAPETGGRA